MASPFIARLRGVGWEAYVWLIYAVPFLIASFDTRLSALETTAMLIGLVVFLALYLTGQVLRGPRLLWIVVAFDLLAVIFSQRNPGAGSFWIYGSAHARPRLPAAAGGDRAGRASGDRRRSRPRRWECRSGSTSWRR